MSRNDWMDIPLEDCHPLSGPGEDSLTGVQFDLERKYEELLAAGDYDWFEKTGEVPVIRNGQRGYELFEKLTLRDLPAVLDTFMVLQKEREKANT